MEKSGYPSASVKDRSCGTLSQALNVPTVCQGYGTRQTDVLVLAPALELPPTALSLSTVQCGGNWGCFGADLQPGGSMGLPPKGSGLVASSRTDWEKLL